MLVNFRLVLLYCLLQSPIFASDSSEEDDFCSQTKVSRQICQSMKKFFKHGWMRDEKVDLSQPECKACMEGAILNGQVSSPVQQFLRTTRHIACKNAGLCKSKNSKRHHKVGHIKCTWGPSYWCSSLRSVEECGSHDHCAELWAGQSLSSEDHKPECLDCQRAISELHFFGNKLKENEYFTGYNVGTLRNFSLNGVSPAILCHYMGHCDGLPVRKVKDGKQCTWAHSVWVRTRELYSQGYRDFQEILDKLLDECVIDVSTCKQTVFHVLPIFVSKYGEYLADEKIHGGETPCVETDLCTPGFANTIYCDVCLTFMASAKRALQHNESIEFVRKVMKSVCPFLGEKRADCEDYVDKHIEKWVDDVDANVNPVKICNDLKLCDKPEEITTEATNFNGACEQCEKFVTRLRMRAICPVKKFFNFVLAQMCRFFGPFANQCTLEVDALKDSIVSLINSLIQSEVICSPFCGKNDSISEAPEQFTIEWVSTKAADHICALDYDCQEKTSKLLQTVLSWLDQWQDCTPADNFFPKESLCAACKSVDAKALIDSYKKSPEEIKLYILNQMCTNGVATSEACAVFAEKYQSQIVRVIPELIEKPDLLCNRLDVCWTEDRCMLCALMSRELERIIPKDSELTEEVVRNALAHSCNNISNVFIDECQKFVDNFEKTIVSLLVNQGRSMRSLCRSMGVCHVSSSPLSMSKCEICRFTVEAVERAVSANASEQQIIAWMDTACSKLPSGYKEQCQKMVRENLPMMIEFLKSLVNVDLVCMKLGLCSPNNCSAQGLFDIKDYCPLCEMALVKIRPWAENSSLMKILRPYLEDACIHQLPEEYHEGCRQDPMKHFCSIIKVCSVESRLNTFEG